jgi:hypothetical protein
MTFLSRVHRLTVVTINHVQTLKAEADLAVMADGKTLIVRCSFSDRILLLPRAIGIHDVV